MVSCILRMTLCVLILTRVRAVRLYAARIDVYKRQGTDSNFIEWIKKINSREAGFTNTYNEADGTFDSRYDGAVSYTHLPERCMKNIKLLLKN